MSEQNQIRWLQRLENFERACAQVESACARSRYSELELAGLIHLF
jgi:hypothetical protein